MKISQILNPKQLKFHLATLCDNWEYLLLIPISHLLPELEHLILNQNSHPVHVFEGEAGMSRGFASKTETCSINTTAKPR